MSIKYLSKLKDRSILPVLEDNKSIDDVNFQNCNFDGICLSDNDLTKENLEALLRSEIKIYEKELKNINLLKKYASKLGINYNILTPTPDTVEIALEKMNLNAHKSLNTLLRMLLSQNS